MLSVFSGMNTTESSNTNIFKASLESIHSVSSFCNSVLGGLPEKLFLILDFHTAGIDLIRPSQLKLENILNSFFCFAFSHYLFHP